MATTVTSVRVSDEQFEQFKAMQKELGGGAEFSGWALEMYKMHQSTKTSDQFAKDIEKIEGMMKALVGTVNGIVSKAEGEILEKDADIAEELRMKDEVAGDLKAEMELLRAELKLKDEEIGNREQSIKEVKNTLEEAQKTLAKVQKEYETTSNLNQLLMEEKARYKGIEDANEQLATDNKELVEKLAEAEKQATGTMQELTEWKHKVTLNEEKYYSEMSNLKKEHSHEIKHLEGLKEVEVSKAVLNAKEEAQAKTEARIEIENQLRKEIDGLVKESYATNNRMKEIEDARIKEVSELKAEIEQLKTKTPAPATKETSTEEIKADKSSKNKVSKTNTDK